MGQTLSLPHLFIKLARTRLNSLRHQLDILQRNHNRQIHGTISRSISPNLADLHPESHAGNGRHRFLYCSHRDVQNALHFPVLSLDRRKIIHFNVTTNPTADWTSLQLIQAFPFDTAPRFLIRDRDGIYGQQVVSTLKILGINQVVTSRRSPWQNGYCERVIGTINTPTSRLTQPIEAGPIKSESVLGGLHHRYFRDVA